MRPTDQRTPPDPWGDCFSACLASMLELPLEDVPVFTDRTKHGDYWTEDVNAWLEPHGLCLVGFLEAANVVGPPLCLHIASGPPHNPSAPEVEHAVVMHGDVVVHDGHPERRGISSVNYRWLLLPRLPGAPVFPEPLRSVKRPWPGWTTDYRLMLLIGANASVWFLLALMALMRLLKGH